MPKIDKDKLYYPTELVEFQLPELDSIYLIKQWIKRGKLKATLAGGSGKGRRYRILGQWALDFEKNILK